MHQITQCNLCGQNQFKLLLKGKDKLYGTPGEFNIVKCLNCSLAFINPQPSSPELAKHYPEDSYYSFKLEKEQQGWFFKILNAPFFAIYWILAKPLGRYRKFKRGAKILDVGCGAGEFLLKLKKKGLLPYGVELNKQAATKGQQRGLNIHAGILREARFPDKFFDIITLNHVLEHVPSPAKTLEELKRILKDDGLLVIAVPNINSLAYKIFKSNWIQLDVPRHLYDFSPKTLKKYASELDWRIKKTRYNSTDFQFWGSLLYLISNKKKKASTIRSLENFYLLRILLLPFAYILNWLKIGDAVEVRLIKKSK